MTAQIAEYLRYQGEGVRMCTEPPMATQTPPLMATSNSPT